MYAKPKRLAVTLIIAAFLVGMLVASMPVGYGKGSGGRIDVFTQKEPYSGRGINVHSDAFGPEEFALLYALVTYNDAPVQSILVAYEVRLPNGTSFTRSSVTNSSGISTANFTVPMPRGNVKENDVFGMWSVLVKAAIDGFEFQDTVFFKVDWIVKLISVRPIYQNLTFGTVFGLGGEVGLEITLQSIAMSLKSAMIAVAIQDEVHIPVSHVVIRDLQVQPNEKLAFIYCRLSIPAWAYVGDATVFVSALTGPASEGGVPYCPEISSSLYISPYVLVDVAFHDVAVVYDVSSPSSVEKGQHVTLSVVATNEGTETESFTVTAYCGSVFVGSSKVVNLSPYAKTTLSFDLDTSTLGAGNYSLKALIPPLANEADLTDNLYVGGVLEVRLKPPVLFHDVAVVSVACAPNLVYSGDIVDVNVVANNLGNYSEFFNVTALYDSNVIGTMFVNGLAAGGGKTLTFHWNTNGVAEGVYALTGVASYVPSETNLENNRYSDGFVRIVARPQPVHDVAVLNVVPASRLVAIGDVLSVNVTVKNKGTVSESFDVVLYYMQRDQRVAGTMRVDNLAAGTQYVLVFSWDTTRVSAGNYTLIGYAQPVAGETKTADNWVEDGTVRIFAGPRSEFVPDWLFWFFLILLLLMLLAILLLWLYYRRRKKSETSFYSGWTAWYYGYDLRNKPREFRK